MIEELLKDILEESKNQDTKMFSEQLFIENILDNIYQFSYKRGQPVHTIAIGILRGNTFDMFYKGRILEKYAEMFGAMSYETTIAGRACELYKNEGKPYLYMPNRKMIYEEFEAGWAVDSYEELEEALKTLRQDPSYRPYSAEDVKKYITEIVYNGEYGRDVLGDFKDLILNALREYHE